MMGDAQAKRLVRWLSELAAVESVMELLQGNRGRCHALQGDLKGYFAMDLSPKRRLMFKLEGDTAIITDLEGYHYG